MHIKHEKNNKLSENKNDIQFGRENIKVDVACCRRNGNVIKKWTLREIGCENINKVELRKERARE
jgi:hypothetical protein